jgi:hypothetical protein
MTLDVSDLDRDVGAPMEPGEFEEPVATVERPSADG